MKKLLVLGMIFFSFSGQSKQVEPMLLGDPVYLGKADIDYMKVMPPVPTRGDAIDTADFEKLLSYQKSRTRVECARSESIVKVTVGTLFGKPYGPLTDSEVSMVQPLLTQVMVDTNYFVQLGKKENKRLRPYEFNPKVIPCITKEKSFAYPSGHTAIAKVLGLLLADLFPERKEAFIARANQIAEDRVLGGVHHPSDLVGGRAIADEAYQKLKVNKKFEEAFLKLK